MEEKKLNENETNVLSSVETETSNLSQNLDENNVETASETETVITETAPAETVSETVTHSEVGAVEQEIAETAESQENDNKSSEMRDFESARARLMEINSRKPVQQSYFKVAGKNLKEAFSNIYVIIYSSIGAVLSLLGLLFFCSLKNNGTDLEFINSCKIMIVAFAVILSICAIVLIISIVMNIIRVSKKKDY